MLEYIDPETNPVQMGSEVHYHRGPGLPSETGVVVDYDAHTNRYYVAVELTKIHPMQILATRGIVNRFWAPVDQSLFQRSKPLVNHTSSPIIPRGLIATTGDYWLINQQGTEIFVKAVPSWKRFILWLIGL